MQRSSNTTGNMLETTSMIMARMALGKFSKLKKCFLHACVVDIGGNNLHVTACFVNTLESKYHVEIF